MLLITREGKGLHQVCLPQENADVEPGLCRAAGELASDEGVADDPFHDVAGVGARGFKIRVVEDQGLPVGYGRLGHALATRRRRYGS
ncbi:hypothetical protein ACFV98_24110 [Streptomyces violascens]|uniref:hypothetical protein n=1 Tax=Streptomyces violascens TaxID=67381 RepID=UPI003659C8FF